MPPTHSRLQRVTVQVWLAVGVLLLLAIALRVLAAPLGVLIPPLLLALLIVYLLNPVVAGLARSGVPRWAGTGVAYLAFVLVLGGLAGLLAPRLVVQLQNFAEVAPELGIRLVDGVNGLLATIGTDLRVDESLSGDQLAGEIQRFLSAQENRTALLALLGGISGLALGLVHLLVVLIAGPFIAFYALVDLPRLSRWGKALLPPQHRAEAEALARRLGRVVGGYVRGQLAVALFVGLATSLGLWIIGLPFWLIVGVIAGITNLVPLVGPFVGGLVGVTIAMVTEGVSLAVLVVVVVTIVQQLDGHLVSPLVVGRSVRLHPLMVLLALLVAGTLYGIFGMLVAIPLVAAASVVVSHFWTSRIPWAGTQAAAETGASAEPETVAS